MRLIAPLLTCLGLAVCALALADQPSTSASPAPAPAAAATTTTTTDASKPATTAASTPTAMVNGIPAEHERQIRAMGYQPELRHGDIYYCRKEMELGSRFETKTCRRAAEIERLTLESRAVTDKIQREGSLMNAK